MTDLISIEILHRYESFIVTTTTRERFEIQPNSEGFMIRDLTPPINDMSASILHSLKTKNKSLVTARPEDIMFFDGVAKGFHFAWKQNGSQELMTTNGTIESCTRKIEIGNLTFNLQMLESPGRKFMWNFEIPKPFTIRTKTDSYTFESIDGNLSFEGRKLYTIMSLYKSKQVAIPELFSHESEYDAITDMIYYNHPFVIFTEESGKLKMSIVNEPVLDCSFS